MADEQIYVVSADSHLRDVDKRAKSMAKIFIMESLPVALTAEEWAEVRDFAPSLLQGLYPEILFLGPHVNDYKVFHRDLLRFTMRMQHTGDSRFKNFLDDLINTYADRHLTDNASVGRRMYFDLIHAHAYSRVLAMDLQTDPTVDRSNLYAKFWALGAVPAKRTQHVNTALRVATMLMLMRDVPPLRILTESGKVVPGCIIPGRWEQLLVNHEAFCKRWGFTQLSVVKRAQVTDAAP